MNIQIKKSLFDIQSSISAIAIHMGNNRNFFYYQKNITVKRAIERELEIIGEAVNRILKEQPDFKLSNARRIVDLRNYIIHAYDSIDDETIWGVVTIHIPKLEAEILEILNLNC